MIRLLSLFSGIGAFEKSLKNSNISFDIVNFSEIDKFAIKSYSAIHNVDIKKNLGDISKIDILQLPDNIDMITYGFPCQSVSLSGKKEGLKKGETKSGLVFDALKIIDHLKPKYAIAENVKSLINKQFIDSFNELLNILDKIGYNSYWSLLNAKDYGVPQNRERIFLVSIRKDVDDKKFMFPEKRDYGMRVKDILEKEVDEKYINKSQEIREVLNDLNNNYITPSSSNKLIRLKRLRNNQGYTIYDINGIACTQTADGGGLGANTGLYYINKEIRRLSPLENWKLMGFSKEDFDKAKQCNISDTSLYRQSGNSIVINVLMNIFDNLLK